MPKNLSLVTGAVGAVVMSLSLLTVSPVSAATVTFITPAGSSTGGGPVNASAAFTTSAGSLSVTLTNLQANITDVAQALSDLSFTTSNGIGIPGFSSSGQEITVGATGSFTTGSTVSTGWAISVLGGSNVTLDVLGTPTAPAHLIIGPPGAGNTYSAANGSIAGNGPHNPFLNQSASFTISNALITANTLITSAKFSFGTTEGQFLITGVPSTPAIPIPGALPLFATGLGVLGLLGWRRKRKAAA